MSEMKNEFSWSKSRDSLFRECLRAYYLNHYGAWGGWSDSAPEEVRALYIMKNLSNRAMWKGIVVHDVAERTLRSIRDGNFWLLDDALGETEARMRKELELSQGGRYRNGAWTDWGGRQIKAIGLQEHFYGLSIHESEWEADIALALTCVRNLYKSGTLRRLREVGQASIISVEDLESFDVDGVKVWVKLDLLVKGHEDKYVIVDWKTGGSHRANDIALQLGIYGLFGSQRWDVPSERILGYDVNLRDGATRKHPIDDAVLERVTDYIRDSAGRMKALLADAENNQAEIDAFPLTNNLRTCQRCRFRRACERE